MATTVLVVEDDPNIADLLRFHLARESYAVHAAADGDTALALAEQLQPDLVLLDVMLPNRSGLDVCQALRRRPGPQPAILMISARVDEVDAVMGITVGADDYVRKPFGVSELVARVRTLLAARAARAQAPAAAPATGSPDAEDAISAGPLRLELAGRRVELGGARLDLTPTEFDLLYVLARRPGRVVTRKQLREEVLGYQHEGYERAIDSHVARLRRKLDDAGAPRALVQTVFGVGYRYVLPEAAVAG
jgi:two-component system alkaline phosphatase synthesis response regulator PhoP